ncbi:MAG: RHS repeat-associated core domain-containing protein [Bacteroidales bacterium]|nr:RHS repeat-associated core domain-containing protein [Bacteroidales bacterium]
MLDYILHDEGMVVKTSSGFQYQYFLKDHLGNTRVVFEGSGNTLQVADYYPFGSRFVPFNPESSNKYLYNGKELQDDVIGGAQLGWLDYGARFYDPQIGRWHVIDNKTEKYYSWSPYVYAINDPVKFTDPDGNDIYIWYPGDDGKQTPFRFNGTNGSSAPSNAYVQSVLKAYDYDVKNGGGDNLKEAASNSKIRVSVVESNVETGSFYDNNGNVYWNPLEGTLSEDGSLISSAATTLEHEMDHAVDDAKDPEAHKERGRQEDKKYGNKEEERVITGSEAKTAQANKEYKPGQKQQSHGGTRIILENPTSTKVDKAKSLNIYETLKKAGFDVDKFLKNINQNIK